MTTLSISIPRPVHPTGVWGWITTIDHKRIGILYGVTAFVLFVMGGVEALIMRTQLARSELDLVSPETFNQLFTMHGTTMIFLAIMPMGAAFFNYIIPLQIGARDVAFPRLNAFSYWTFLAGAIMLNGSWFLGGAPNAGWFGYAPITGEAYNPGHGIDFWIMSLQILGIASLAAAFNFIVTILNMRAPGMTLMRMPLFTWMTLITAFLLVLAFPVITVALIELMFDRFFGTNFFVPAAGANPVLWQHLFWVFGHPGGVHPDPAGDGHRLRDTTDKVAAHEVVIRDLDMRGRYQLPLFCRFPPRRLDGETLHLRQSGFDFWECPLRRVL